MFMRYMRGMVYWARLQNMDKNNSVTMGTRPVIIVSNNTCNRSSSNITVVPCTTNVDKKPNQPTHTIIYLNKDTPSLVLCEDIMTIPKTTLSTFMGILDDVIMEKINDCLLIQLGMQDAPTSSNTADTTQEDLVTIETKEIVKNNKRQTNIYT